jgi:hypothetical protein
MGRSASEHHKCADWRLCGNESVWEPRIQWVQNMSARVAVQRYCAPADHRLFLFWPACNVDNHGLKGLITRIGG